MRRSTLVAAAGALALEAGLVWLIFVATDRTGALLLVAGMLLLLLAVIDNGMGD